LRWHCISDIPADALDRQQRVECRPSRLTKAAIQAAYSLNVGNLRDTGHSVRATPAAAMAEVLTFAVAMLTDCSWLRIQPVDATDW